MADEEFRFAITESIIEAEGELLCGGDQVEKNICERDVLARLLEMDVVDLGEEGEEGEDCEDTAGV